jgi:hypothetical protein
LLGQAGQVAVPAIEDLAFMEHDCLQETFARDMSQAQFLKKSIFPLEIRVNFVRREDFSCCPARLSERSLNAVTISPAWGIID